MIASRPRPLRIRANGARPIGEPPRTPALLAIIRLAALPVILAGERLVDHPHGGAGGFLPVFVLSVGYATATAWQVWRRPAAEKVPSWQVTLDLLLLCALAYTSGGPFSQARDAFFIIPVAAALLARPRVTAMASLAAVAAYVFLAVTHPTRGLPQGLGLQAVHVAYLLWAGLAATVVSTALARRAAQVAELAAGRGRLVARTLEAEDQQRRRLAEALHDDAIQNLLAARQELAPNRLHGADLEMVRLGLDRTVAQLRGAVFDLHPYLLEHAGLGPALEAVAEDCARWGGFEPDVSVDHDVAGDRAQLLFSVGRELIRNVARHAEAERLLVEVAREDDTIFLIVADDGRGFDRDRLRAAPLTGHIGLASMAERVEAVGGAFTVEGGPGVGTRVEIQLPADERAFEPEATAARLRR